MFTCSKCHLAVLVSIQPEREQGDWIIRCPQCEAHNILSLKLSGSPIEPGFEVVGWKDAV